MDPQVARDWEWWGPMIPYECDIVAAAASTLECAGPNARYLRYRKLLDPQHTKWLQRAIDQIRLNLANPAVVIDILTSNNLIAWRIEDADAWDEECMLHPNPDDSATFIWRSKK
jgi:hypothetical protein